MWLKIAENLLLRIEDFAIGWMMLDRSSEQCPGPTQQRQQQRLLMSMFHECRKRVILVFAVVDWQVVSIPAILCLQT